MPHEGPASEAPPAAQGPLPPFGTLGLTLGPGCVCVSQGCQVSASSSVECGCCLRAVLRGNRVQEAWSGPPFPIRGASLGRCCQLPWRTRGAQGTRPPGPILCLYWARQVPSPAPLTSPPEDVGQFLIQVGKVPTQLGKPPNPPSPPSQAPRLGPPPLHPRSSSPTATCLPFGFLRPLGPSSLVWMAIVLTVPGAHWRLLSHSPGGELLGQLLWGRVGPLFLDLTQMEGKLGLLGPELGPQLQVHLFLEDGAGRWEGPRVSWLPAAGSAVTRWERLGEAVTRSLQGLDRPPLS